MRPEDDLASAVKFRSEPGESELTMLWATLGDRDREQRGRERLAQLLDRYRETGDATTIREAASQLSVLRASMGTTDEGRKEYARLEAELDQLEEEQAQNR